MPRTRNVSFYGPGQGPLGGDALRRDYQSDPRRRMEQQLMAQGSSTAPVQSPWEGITRALSGVAGGYFAGLSRRGWEAKEAAAAKEVNAILRGLQPTPIPPPAPIPDPGGGDYEAANFVDGLYPPTHTGGGYAGAIAAGRDATSLRARAMLQTLMINQAAQQQADVRAEQERHRALVALTEQRRYNEGQAETKHARAIVLDQLPGGPLTGRPASGIQYKQEYDRILAGPGGQKAADAFLRDFVNQPWMNIGGRWVPRAGAGAGADGPSVPIALKPGEEPEVRAAQAAAAVVGADRGTAITELAAADASMPGLVTAVNRLKEIGKTATYTLGGQLFNYAKQQIGMDPSASARGRATYIAHVKNNVLPLLRQTFGAAFTAAEGDSLLTTLGDPNMHPAEKDAVLDAFIENKMRDLETKRRRVMQDSGEAPAAPGPVLANDDPVGIR
jgi:hypothetical protein